ncbi:MAG: hypothetical protein JWQ28_857, partial [Pedobacter sp.]|nr:hypothetical protein [Pedobacter sp.]
MEKLNRRSFLETAGIITGGVLLGNSLNLNAADGPGKNPMVKLSGHIWVYASKYPPNWDSTPVIEQAFSDFSYA